MTSYQSSENFMQPFDPSERQLSDEEKYQASQEFSILVDDLLLANMNTLHVDDNRNVIAKQRLYQHTQDGQYVSHIDVFIICDKDQNKAMQLAEYQKSTQPVSRTTHYVVNVEEDEVTRSDNFDEAMQEDKSSPDQKRVSGIVESLDELVEKVDSETLEIAMGYNAQAVSSREIQLLRELFF
jgi:hypothetical protein